LLKPLKKIILKIIAESAFNHNGSLDYLKELAIEAKKTKADYFTIQIMDVAEFCTKDYSKYKIYEENTLTFPEWQEFFKYSKEIDLKIIPCVLDTSSFDFCYSEGFRFLKLHATDISNIAMLEKMATFDDVSFILETQCATNLELKFALNLIGDKVECLMHGFSNYPTEVEDLNLNTLDYFATEYPNYSTGLADHSLDIDKIPLMVLAKGCDYIEKHITLSRNNRNFDYQVSLYPHEFSAMVSYIRHYEKALGNVMKHPTKTELSYRNVMYKKVVGPNEFKRADYGLDYISHKFNSFKKENIGIALIARLKSQRLPQKVLKPFHDTILIDFLYKRLNTSIKTKKTVLATSTLLEDAPLAQIGYDNKFNVYLGHAVSVIDRMLELAFQEEFGGVFRVTGDNPFTDVELIDEMIDLFVANDLDYVRVNNTPFGVSAELFSTEYLWKLYLEMSNPMNSEYLTYFILKDDTAKKGCIDIISDIEDLKFINLSVDYQEDLDQALELVTKLNSKNLYTSNLKDMVLEIKDFKRENKDKYIKLPEGEEIQFSKFLDQLSNQNYKIRKTIKI
tara:strand:+ start:11900 stop:13591 length:1692 start_codon:yes stop_codon:yes gene_type:complete